MIISAAQFNLSPIKIPQKSDLTYSPSGPSNLSQCFDAALEIINLSNQNSRYSSPKLNYGPNEKPIATRFPVLKPYRLNDIDLYEEYPHERIDSEPPTFKAYETRASIDPEFAWELRAFIEKCGADTETERKQACAKFYCRTWALENGFEVNPQ